jgi:hypothetical protein
MASRCLKGNGLAELKRFQTDGLACSIAVKNKFGRDRRESPYPAPKIA